jgi:hypothetical protein
MGEINLSLYAKAKTYKEQTAHCMGLLGRAPRQIIFCKGSGDYTRRIATYVAITFHYAALPFRCLRASALILPASSRTASGNIVVQACKSPLAAEELFGFQPVLPRSNRLTSSVIYARF